MRPIILDLFCGAGGTAKGYADAGFDCVGVDVEPQPNYPYCFVQADAFDALDKLTLGQSLECQHGHRYAFSDFAAIHASPPCQGESIMRYLPWLRDKDYPMLIIPTRERLQRQPLPWVIENVAYARRSKKKPHGMQAGFLCGTMFGLPLYRHRAFESSFFWMQPGHPKHTAVILAGGMLKGRQRTMVYSRPNGTQSSRANSAGSHRSNAEFEAAKEGFGIDWMTRDELSQAIPPAYTEYIGKALMGILQLSERV